MDQVGYLMRLQVWSLVLMFLSLFGIALFMYLARGKKLSLKKAITPLVIGWVLAAIVFVTTYANVGFFSKEFLLLGAGYLTVVLASSIAAGLTTTFFFNRFLL